MLMTGESYRDSLRSLSPRVFVNGGRVDSVADEPLLAPGVNAIAHGYDMAHDARYTHLMTAVEQTTGRTVNRMTHIDRTPQDLIEKLEAVRLMCRAALMTGWAICKGSSMVSTSPATQTFCIPKW